MCRELGARSHSPWFQIIRFGGNQNKLRIDECAYRIEQHVQDVHRIATQVLVGTQKDMVVDERHKLHGHYLGLLNGRVVQRQQEGCAFPSASKTLPSCAAVSCHVQCGTSRSHACRFLAVFDVRDDDGLIYRVKHTTLSTSGAWTLRCSCVVNAEGVYVGRSACTHLPCAHTIASLVYAVDHGVQGAVLGDAWQVQCFLWDVERSLPSTNTVNLQIADVASDSQQGQRGSCSRSLGVYRRWGETAAGRASEC